MYYTSLNSLTHKHTQSRRHSLSPFSDAPLRLKVKLVWENKSPLVLPSLRLPGPPLSITHTVSLPEVRGQTSQSGRAEQLIPPAEGGVEWRGRSQRSMEPGKRERERDRQTDRDMKELVGVGQQGQIINKQVGVRQYHYRSLRSMKGLDSTETVHERSRLTVETGH